MNQKNKISLTNVFGDQHHNQIRNIKKLLIKFCTTKKTMIEKKFCTEKNEIIRKKNIYNPKSKDS